ncbi:LPS-assembly lipoprotein LptE [Aquabacterium humicola]|uniref:LPS-assembly lipoprotein LptE n=1 Tax=Aquabacterium humicola TaxID=3237377 RepID=UPI002543EE7E|nr:LPS assembly lipoprotein LptE [Rubrivivax pictus]
MRRRSLLAAALLPPALAGCGFQLRRAPELPFTKLALVGFAPRSPLADELKRTLEPTVEVVADPNRAEAVLQAIADRRERSVTALTAAGQVRGVQLRVRLEFRLTTPGGREYIPDTTLQLARDMSYSETFALAKEQEEQQLYAAMQTDIVLLLMRRLAEVKKA